VTNTTVDGTRISACLQEVQIRSNKVTGLSSVIKAVSNGLSFVPLGRGVHTVWSKHEPKFIS